MRAASAFPVRPGLWRGLLVAGALFFVGYAAWALLLNPDPEVEDLVSSLLLIGLSLGGSGASLSIALDRSQGRKLRWGWLFIGLACGANALAEAIWLEFRLRFLDPFPSTADVAFLAFYPLILAGIFILPTASTRPRERRILWLDAAIGLSASLIVWWYSVLAPQTVARSIDERTVLSVLYPAADVLLISLLLMMTERSWDTSARPVMLLLALAMTMMTSADSVFAYFEPRALIYSYPPLNLLWASAYFLLFAAATMEGSLLEAKPTTEARIPNPKRRLAWILFPYLSVAVASGVLLSASLRSPREPLSYLVGVVIGTLALFALVLLRQYLVLRENVDLHVHATRASLTDELTGLANRRHFLRVLDHEAKRAMRYGRACSVLLLDVDDLKVFNDRFGHTVGDQVLVRLARLLVDNLRTLDTPARLGGDEFGVLLPETGAAAARVAATRLNASIRSARVAGMAMSASIGLGSFKPGATPESILEEADQDLYRVKRERQANT
ncbi:MAG: hypothetical protein A2Z17_07520 [Gammaproteobacteria bacterium RBG_16_66_13]|nr:MAG: hypothetical protein A2Z17_07520 [Gammaproteobacteria bacterium RBG_16_66_13]